jgi:hypothetical protein
MKTCAYCGRENEDSAVHCGECGTEEFKAPEACNPPSEAETGEDLVTLATCATLAEADRIAGQLMAEGITVFIPDQFLMQNASLGAAYGFIRVQVASGDLEASRELLAPPAPPAPPLLPASPGL